MKTFTKIIKKTYTVRWVKPDFTIYDDKYITIRARMHYKGNECFLCGKLFKIGDTIGLMSVKEDSNKTVCSICANRLNIPVDPLEKIGFVQTEEDDRCVIYEHGDYVLTFNKQKNSYTLEYLYSRTTDVIFEGVTTDKIFDYFECSDGEN